MKVLAVDVGMSTGLAYGEIGEARRPPGLVCLKTGLPGVDPVGVLESIVHPDELELLVIEYPLVQPLSSGSKDLQDWVAQWVKALSTYGRARRYLITASMWKSTPSSKQVYWWVNQGFEVHSQHEKDAAQILHWYAVFAKRLPTPILRGLGQRKKI